LHAGDWKSPAFLSYLDVHKLEEAVVAESHEPIFEELSDSGEDES